MSTLPSSEEQRSSLHRVPASLRRLDVLVVDDDVAAHDALRAPIAALGHRVRVADDGETAWRMLKDEPADVVLCDWEMPNMNGVELCRRIRSAPSFAPYTYVILMTAHASRERLRIGMEAGADDFQRKPLDLDELEARLTAAGRVVALHRELALRNAELRTDSERFYADSRTDALTGLGNRLRLREDVEAALSRADRYGEQVCLAICDIDGFKTLNDAFGHRAGDDALVRIGHALRRKLRASDGVFRYGGDEIVVLFPEQALPDARSALERVCSEIGALAIPAPDARAVTISVGVAEHAAGEPQAALFARADAALYRAKQAGKNRIVEAAPIPKS